jgi:hypothetical protein
MKILNPNAHIVVHPQVSASRIDLGIPRAELSKRDARSGVNRITAVARLDLIEGFAVAHDSWHLWLGPRGRRLGRRAGSGSARNVDTDIVVQPEIGAT